MFVCDGNDFFAPSHFSLLFVQRGISSPVYTAMNDYFLRFLTLIINNSIQSNASVRKGLPAPFTKTGATTMTMIIKNIYSITASHRFRPLQTTNSGLKILYL